MTLLDETAVTRPRIAPPVVVFDFDGTLTSRDSFVDFGVRYCASRPARLLLVGALLPVAILLSLVSRPRAGSILLWAMTVGSSTRSFVVALRHYARYTLPSYANEAVIEELVRHLMAGSQVAIATGTVPLLVRGLLDARGIGRLPIAGSRLRRKWGGLVAETYCTGKTKVGELSRRFGICDWSTVYTDSFADRPLLVRARYVTLVSPSGRTLLRTRRLIDPATTLRVLRAG
ncbi:MAG: haloacid dehalogenase-like hydrolase [Polyangiaceae bacterium]